MGEQKQDNDLDPPADREDPLAPADGAVGHGRPPRHSRFRKGQSGNPKGRPKRIDDPVVALERVLSRRITVSGASRRMTIREALLRRLRERALAGNRKALALQQKILVMAKAIAPPEPKPADEKSAVEHLAELVAKFSADKPSPSEDPS